MQWVTAVTLLVNALLAAAKSGLGALSGNQALLADGVHSVFDAVTDGLVLFGAPLWSKPPDEAHPYGRGRIETLLTLLIASILASVGLGLVVRAVEGLHTPVTPSMSAWTFSAAIASILVNEVIFQWSKRAGERVNAPILVANAWHHRSDGLSSIPVALSIAVQAVKPEWTFVDPAAALLVSVVVLKSAWEIGRDAVRQLVDAAAPEDTCAVIEALVLEHPEIRSLHALRTRHVGAGLQVDMHIQVDPEITVAEGHRIAHQVQRELIERGPNVIDVLLHVEPDDGHDAGLTGDIGWPPLPPSS